MEPPQPPAFTPRTLAERWHCSERHVRNMVDGGELRAFRLGGKLLRVSAEAVAEYESRTVEPKRRL